VLIAKCFDAKDDIMNTLSYHVLLFAFMMFSAGQANADPIKIFWASDPVRPGQTVQISGMGLNGVQAVDVVRLADLPEQEAAADTARRAELLAKTENSLSFVLPAELFPGVFSVTLSSGEDRSTVQLNAPDIYWMQGDGGTVGSPGGWLRISGRNMAINRAAVAVLVAEDGMETRIAVQEPDTWSASFPLPENLAAGFYRVRLSNGTGDVSAWRDAGTFAVVRKPIVERPVMELRGYPSANAAAQDDTARINASLEALGKRGGGTLLLRYGRYRLSAPLVIPNGVTLKGESNQLVSLVWKDFESPPESLIHGVKDFSVEDVTIFTARHFHIIRGGVDPVSWGPIGSNIAIRRVVVRAMAFMGHIIDDEPHRRLAKMQSFARDGAIALLLGGSNIVVEDCDILSSMRSFVLIKPSGARLTGNTFRNGRLGWYGISGPDGVLFENNLVVGADLQSTGGGVNTLAGNSAARNVLIRNNKYQMMFGWDREAMTSDGPGGYYSGPIKSASGRSIWIGSTGLGNLEGKNWKGAGFFVLHGRGLGLVARVVKRAGGIVELDRDVSADTDNSSVVSIVPMQDNYLVIGNSFQDVGGAQIFGTGYKHVFAGNTALRSDGFVATSLNYNKPQPNFYIQFLGNEASSPLLGTTGINVIGRQDERNPTLLTFGLVIRENHLQAGASIRINGQSADVPVIRNVLVEQNEISEVTTAIDTGPGVKDLVIRGNSFKDVLVPINQRGAYDK
jgi:hypothetical protein